MSDTSVARLLEECAGEVLSTMCFTGADGVVDFDGEAPGPGAVAASLAFQGSHSGEFAVSMPRNVAACLAARFYGFDEDEELPPGHSELLVCELANMICGSFLSRMDPDRSFTLASPGGFDSEESARVEWNICRTPSCRKAGSICFSEWKIWANDQTSHPRPGGGRFGDRSKDPIPGARP